MLLGLIGSTTVAQGQITISSSDYPQTTYVVHSLQDTSSLISPGIAGVAQTWNYASFTSGDTATVTTDYTVNNPNPQFPGANSTPCNSFPPFTTFCNYLEFSSSGLYYHGNYGEMNQGSLIKMWMNSQPKQPDMVFPFTYNSINNSSYVQNQLITYTPALGGNDSARTNYHRTQTIEADAWGSITTPFGTYNALRVKRTQTNLDTTFVHASGGAWSQSATSVLDTTVTYTWIANGVNVVANMSNYTSVPGNTWRYVFYKTSIPSGQNDPATELSFTCYPNPSRHHFILNFPEANTVSGEGKLMDLHGRCVQQFSLNGQHQVVQLSGVSAGIYLLQLQVNGKWGHQKLMVE